MHLHTPLSYGLRIQESHLLFFSDRLLWLCLRLLIEVAELVGHTVLTLIAESSGPDHLTAALALDTYLRLLRESKLLLTDPSLDLWY